MLFFELHGKECDLSVMRISDKLMKRKTTTKKFEKFLKTINFKNFQTIHYNLAALTCIIYSILKSKLTRPLSILRIQKIKKTLKNSKVKKIREKSVGANKK